jgi:hypothetical protein
LDLDEKGEEGFKYTTIRNFQHGSKNYLDLSSFGKHLERVELKKRSAKLLVQQATGIENENLMERVGKTTPFSSARS